MKQIKLADPDLLGKQAQETLNILRAPNNNISSEINPLKTNFNIKWFRRLRNTSHPKYVSNTAEKQLKQEIQELFNKFDIDKSGGLSLFEIHKAFRSIGLQLDYKDIFSMFHYKSNKVIYGIGESLTLQQFEDAVLSYEANHKFKILIQDMRRAIIEKDLKDVKIEIDFLPTNLIQMFRFLFQRYQHNKALNSIYQSLNNVDKNAQASETIEKDFSNFHSMFAQGNFNPSSLQQDLINYSIPKQEIAQRLRRKNQTMIRRKRLSDVISYFRHQSQQSMCNKSLNDQETYQSHFKINKKHNMSLDLALQEYKWVQNLQKQEMSLNESLNDRQEKACDSKAVLKEVRRKSQETYSNTVKSVDSPFAKISSLKKLKDSPHQKNDTKTVHNKSEVIYKENSEIILINKQSEIQEKEEKVEEPVFFNQTISHKIKQYERSNKYQSDDPYAENYYYSPSQRQEERRQLSTYYKTKSKFDVLKKKINSDKSTTKVSQSMSLFDRVDLKMKQEVSSMNKAQLVKTIINRFNESQKDQQLFQKAKFKAYVQNLNS